VTDVVIDVDHPTAEAEWAASGLEHLRPFRAGPPATVVVVAPHPDDEVLAVGGLLQVLHRAGHRIEVVAVTDGEASHPGSRAIGPRALAAVRRIEAAQARRVLGLAARSTVHVGLPDGAVADHEDRLADVLADRLDPRSIVLATWRGDGHPDHEATGRAAASAAALTGARLVEYPVWAWSWARPGDGRLPWPSASAVHLLEAVQRAKHRAIQAFTSQLAPLGPDPADGPVVPPAVLAHHLRPFEVVFG
jgi:LmbE family N-acetylglucosaminyl deacetylase